MTSAGGVRFAAGVRGAVRALAGATGALAACWTAVAPPPAPAPTPVLPDARSPGELAAELAAELRAPAEPMSPPPYLDLDRAVAVLDLETGTTAIVCDAALLGPAAAWSDLLVDPDRPPPRCQAGRDQRFSCVQRGPPDHDTLILTFHRGPTWRLLGVAIGPWRAQAAPLLRDHRARLADAACP